MLSLHFVKFIDFVCNFRDMLEKLWYFTDRLFRIYEPHREKTRFLPRRKQRRRSASR